ncbi:MAG TPA: alpha/beta family hydrolase [Streptosporangiaceae bacterium]|nr:alpha/beta family hydrolase [Streptosporangiaceae bacterium]
MEVPTSHGPARVVIESQERPWFLVALTHGAGGGVDSADLLAVRDAVLKRGGTVARITQPYRVRGARAPGSAERQDEAWVEVIAALRAAIADVTGNAGAHTTGQASESGPVDGGGWNGGGIPLVQGGRSNGARVACRTAEAVGAAGVIALAFPLHPPGHPDRSRASELRVPGRKVLVVNGDRDPFGVPGRGAGRRVVVLAGETHALSRHPEAVAKAVRAWLPQVLGPKPTPAPAPAQH